MRRLAFILVTLSMAAPAASLAQKPGDEPTKPKADSPTPPATLSHRYQFGLGVRGGSGYRVIAPYDSSYNCGELTDKGENKSVCGGRQRAWLELSPSFGITHSLELLVDVRFYLEDDFTATKALFVAPGIKYYSDPDELFKFFATGQLVIENQDFGSAGPSNLDLGVRSALGVQFDVLRYLGLYAQGGVELGFKRWLTFIVDFGGGVQVRY